MCLALTGLRGGERHWLARFEFLTRCGRESANGDIGLARSEGKPCAIYLTVTAYLPQTPSLTVSALRNLSWYRPSGDLNKGTETPLRLLLHDLSAGG